MTRTAAAALIGSVLVLGGYAAYRFGPELLSGSDTQLSPIYSFSYPEAIVELESLSQSSSGRLRSAHQVQAVLRTSVLALRGPFPDRRVAEASAEALQQARTCLNADSDPSVFAVPLEELHSSLEVLKNASLTDAQDQLAAIETVLGQVKRGIASLQHALSIEKERDEETATALRAYLEQLKLVLRS